MYTVDFSTAQSLKHPPPLPPPQYTMYKGLKADDGQTDRTMKTVRPAIKFTGKDVKTLLKKKPRADNNARGKREQQSGGLSVVAESKIKNFCTLVQVGELERVRLTEYVATLDPRCIGIELNAWSTSQLAAKNTIRTVSPLSKEAKKQKGKKKKDQEQSILYWIMTVVLNTEGGKKNGNTIKRKDTVILPTPPIPDDQSGRRLLAEYTLLRLWLIVRYVFTTVRTAVAEDPNTLVPIFVVKSDGNSAVGKAIREELHSSQRREVKHLKTVYRCSFVWN